MGVDMSVDMGMHPDGEAYPHTMMDGYGMGDADPLGHLDMTGVGVGVGVRASPTGMIKYESPLLE